MGTNAGTNVCDTNAVCTYRYLVNHVFGGGVLAHFRGVGVRVSGTEVGTSVGTEAGLSMTNPSLGVKMNPEPCVVPQPDPEHCVVPT